MRFLKAFLVVVVFLFGAVILAFSINLKVRVTTSKANIRLKADTQSIIVSGVLLGAVLDVIKKEADWYYVKLPPDEKGKADAEATRNYAQAYSVDADFCQFLKTSRPIASAWTAKPSCFFRRTANFSSSSKGHRNRVAFRSSPAARRSPVDHSVHFPFITKTRGSQVPMNCYEMSRPRRSLRGRLRSWGLS
jgi:hypothetical protein